MSDQPNQNEIVEIANEYRRLERQLKAKTQQLESLLEANGEAGDFPTDFEGIQNRRYSIEFQFKPPPSNPPAAEFIQPQEGSVTVESGTIFRCSYIESFLRVIGTATDAYSALPVTVQYTMPWNQRLENFDYLWRVRDTGTDREWVDHPQPSLFGGGGYWGPLWLPRPVVLSGGTVIFTTLEPSRNQAQNDDINITFQQYFIQMCFVGHEVHDRSRS